MPSMPTLHGAGRRVDSPFLSRKADIVLTHVCAQPVSMTDSFLWGLRASWSSVAISSVPPESRRALAIFACTVLSRDRCRSSAWGRVDVVALKR